MINAASVFDRLEKAGTHAEDALLLVILVSMIFLAGTQIILRNFLDTSIYWGDELLRVLVLWLTIAGALAASRIDKHISIAVLDRFLPPRVQLITKVIIDVFTAGICALFAWHSARFVMGSYEYGDVLMTSIPAWTLQIILPIGFTLMAYRHLVLAARRPFAASIVPKSDTAESGEHQ